MHDLSRACDTVMGIYPNHAISIAGDLCGLSVGFRAYQGDGINLNRKIAVSVVSRSPTAREHGEYAGIVDASVGQQPVWRSKGHNATDGRVEITALNPNESTSI